MNEQALNYSYELFKKDGYTGTLDQYRQLISSDKEALNYSYSLFKNDGYSGSINDFSGLISPAVESPMAIQPKKKEDSTALPSGVGSSASSASTPDPEALRFAELVKKQGQVVGKRRDEPGYVDPRKTLGMYPTKEQADKATAQAMADISASKGMTPEFKEKDFFEGGFGTALRTFDTYSPIPFGEAIDDTARTLASGYAQGQLASAANDLILSGPIPDDETIEKLLEYSKMAKELGPSDSFINYQKKSEEAGGGFFGFFRGVLDNPAVLPELIVNSLTAMATNKEAVLAGSGAVLTNALATAAAAGTPTAGVGAAPGFVAGAASALPVAMGLASGILTTGATFSELIQQELGTDEFGNPIEPTKENTKAILEDPEKFNRIRNKSILKGATVGAIDFFTGKLASSVGAKILSKSAAKSVTGEATRTAYTKSVGAGSTIESTGGAFGEFAGTGIAGEKQNLENILFEAVTEMPMGALSTAQARLAAPVYKVNNKKVTAEQLDEIIDTMEPDDLAVAKIEVENDYEGRKKRMQDKIVTGSIANEVRAAQPDLNEPTVNAIVELQKELNKLEGNKTQVAKDKAAQIRAEIKNLQENQLPEQSISETVVAEAPEAVQKRAARVSEIESIIANDDATFAETGNRPLLAEARQEIQQELETLKAEEDAIQEQAAGQVPVQPGTGVSQEVAQGEPQAEPQGVTEEGQEKINDIERRRQEELSNYDEEGLNETYAIGSDQTVGEFINSKYDTELALLEQSAQQLDLDGEISLLEQLLAQEETTPTQAAGISVSSEADVNDLRNRTQSRSQQATTQEEKESVNTRVKIIDTAKKAIKTLKSIFPDVDIVIHDDEGSYNAAMADIGGVAGSRGNFFIDTTPDGKTTGRIDINLSKANSRTVAHEIAHSILLKTFGDNKNLFNDFRTRISKVLKADVNQQLNDFANQYVDPATGDLLDVNHEEFLAELTGILEQQEANVSVTTMQKVAALINEFVSKITGGKFKPFEDTKNTKDVVEFFNTISSAIREGQSLEGVTEKINPNAEPTGTKVDTSSLKKRSSLIEKLGLERFSDMNQRITEGVTLNSLGDVISHLTFSDRLVTGKVGNKDYLGGILFAAATNRVWASFTKGRISQIISGMPKNEDGYRYLMPALLTEGAHMSNKDMSNTAIKLVEGAIFNGDISPVDADSRIRKALNRKGLESFSKLYSDTIGKNKLTPDLVISAIDNAILKSNSTFEDRNIFLESLLGKADIDLKKRFGTLPSYNVLANGLAEPITNRHEFGDILLVIRTKGDLVAVQPKEGDPDYHPSYPWVIRSVNPDGSIADVETLIFNQSYNAVNVFPEVTNKQGQKFTYQQYVDKYGDGAKSRYLGYMGARSAMSTSVTEKISTEAQPKTKIVSRSQLVGNDAQRIVNLGRANGLSEQAISTVLQKRGFTQEAIDAALAKAEPAAKKVEVTEEFAPGYDRVLNNMFGKDGVVAKSRKRGVSKEGILENAINYLRGTKVYENATDVQREAMERNVNKELGKREKAAPSAEKIVGKPKKKQVTVDEMATLKDQIKLEARAAREAKGDLNTKRKALAARIIAARRKGTITAVQARALVNRISRVNLDNPIMVDRLIQYTDKVFDDANYAADMAELRKLQKQARSRNHTSMTSLVNEFTSINPEDIPLDKIQDYKEALDFLNTRTPFYGKMNEVFDEMLSYKKAEKFDAVKTKDALIDKYNSIMDKYVGKDKNDKDKLKNVEDYVALIKDLNAFKRKAFQLLQNEAINQKEYEDLINGAGETQAVVDRKFAEQIDKIKKGLIAEIKNQRPKPNPNFTKEQNDLIREYLQLNDSDIDSLSPEDLFILNDLLDNISNGEIDYYRLNDIVSRAVGKQEGVAVSNQLKGSKVSLGSAKLREEMAKFESAFWEGLLGLGRATSGPLQKFIISPFNRAIGSYEKFNRDGFNEFLKLKKKYKIDRFDPLNKSKDMHKIGMLTTYLQEYMAQFDPKNKNVKDIGKRDWFKQILDSETMRDDYSPEELKTIEEIYKTLPKDKDGNVDPKAVYDSYEANDGKFFTKNQKAFFDSIMEWKKQNSTGKQKAANEMSGNAFKEIPFHMLRSRYGSMSSQITPTVSGDNGMVRINAGTGKERVSEAVGAVNTNFEKLFIKGLEQTGRDFFLTKALKDINNVLASAKKELDGDKEPLLKAISYTLSDALSYEFSNTASQNILKRLVQARAAMTLLDPIRTGIEFTSTLLSFGLRARTLSGYKNLFGSQGDMKNLLEFTDSPLRLRQNINNAIDINDGKIEKQSMLTKWTTFLSGLPERTMMITSWMPTFTSEFQRITGEKFDMKKFNDSEAYREKYGNAIKEASAVADAQTEKIIGPTTKAGQRREIIIFPGKTVGRDTVSGQILGFFSNYPFRESTEFINGFREAGEVLKKGDSVESILQLQKPLGIALNVAAYGFLSSVAYASRLILLGDDDEEERGTKLLEELMTAKGFIEETAANATALAASKYAGGGRAILQVLGTLGMALTDDEETKATIKKMLKGSVYVDPLPTQKLTGYGTADKVNTAIIKYIPQFVVLSNTIIDAIGGANEFKSIIDKVESKGVDALTKDEELKVLALSVVFTATQLFLNYRGTSLPSYNNLKAGMKAVKEEAGVADIADGNVPAKKSSGGGGGRAKTMNKTDLKRYFPDQYNELYGEGSATYEIEQEVKAFEKEQRELKKKIKDQVYGD